MDTPTRSVATEWEVRLKKKICIPAPRERPGQASEWSGEDMCKHDNEYNDSELSGQCSVARWAGATDPYRSYVLRSSAPADERQCALLYCSMCC